MPSFNYYPECNSHDYVLHYKLPTYTYPTDLGIEFLKKERLDAIKTRDEFLIIQKQCAKQKDYESAKLLSSFSKDQMRRYRAACLCLGWATGGVGVGADCTVNTPAYWSVDLVDELDYMWNYATLL